MLGVDVSLFFLMLPPAHTKSLCDFSTCFVNLGLGGQTDTIGLRGFGMIGGIIGMLRIRPSQEARCLMAKPRATTK